MEKRFVTTDVLLVMSLYISLAYNYWQLVRNSVEEMELQENKTSVIQEYDEENTNDWSYFEENTKWNDQNIGIPLLYNFYHGLELFMKGLLELNKSEIPKGHNLFKLYELLKTNEICYPKEMIRKLKSYVYDFKELNVFFNQNKIDSSKFYECFRYPINKENMNFYFGAIRGKQNVSFELYKKLHIGTIEFYNLLVQWRCPSEIQSNYLKKHKYV